MASQNTFQKTLFFSKIEKNSKDFVFEQLK